MSDINSSPGGGSGPALAESGIPSGRVVAVGFVFDSRTELKNEASQHAYSTRTLRRPRLAHPSNWGKS